MTKTVLRRRRQEAVAFLHVTRNLPTDLRGTYAVLLNLLLAHGGQIEDHPATIASAIGCDPKTWVRRRNALVECGMISLETRNGFRVIFNAAKDLDGKTMIAKPASAAFAESARAPIAPSARVQHFADLVNSDRPIPPGTISLVMAQTLIDSGLVSKRRLRERRITP